MSSSARARPLTEVVHGTTVATNAVLEKLGARTALVTTRGFRDVLELRRMRMPQLYDYFWRSPRPLVARRLPLRARRAHVGLGEVLRALDEEEARAVGGRAAAAGVESVAVCLLHAYAYPEHEELLGECCGPSCPGVPVSLSSRDPARAAGVRADGDDGGERVRPAGDGRLPRGHPRRHRRRGRRGAAPDHAVLGRRDDRRRRGGASRSTRSSPARPRASSPRSASPARSGSRT